MASNPHRSIAEKLGAGIARAWRGYLGKEKAVFSFVVSAGASSRVATGVVWSVRLAVLAAIYFSLPSLPGVLAVGAMLLYLFYGKGRIELPPSPEPPEYRTGHQGTGLYQDSVRIDPYDPDDPEDTR
jgi:hypothetical protein